jgi:predicted RNA methylase
MRFAAQMRGGFYPAPPEVVAFASTFVRPPTDKPFSILDPCAGEGAAICQLAEMLVCPPELTYAIELDDGRTQKLRTTLSEANVLAPASFFGCRASYGSFSCIWLNPPFATVMAGSGLVVRQRRRTI